jgi:phosphoribosylformimino-5-aminoimidazole carboxamide ribotide isomerase
MLLMPAIDLRDGRCVRLYQGDFALATQYAATPLQLLQHYRTLGAPWLHVVDLDGAKDGERGNATLIAALAAERGIRLQAGGGVRSRAAIEALLEAGVARVVIGSCAIAHPAEVGQWLAHFGSERLCLAFDVRCIDGVPSVHTHGWSERSAVTLWQALAAFPVNAVRHVLCTDIERDGALTGPNLDLYRSALSRFPRLHWQASGGVRDAGDLDALARIGVAATISGKALLEDRIPLQELRPFLPDASFPVSTYAPARS